MTSSTTKSISHSRRSSQSGYTGYEGRKWISQGLAYGFFMCISTDILLRMAEKEPILWSRIGYELILWLVVGLLFGYTMKLIHGSRGQKKDRQVESQNSKT